MRQSESCLQPGGRTLCSVLSRTQAVWCWIFKPLLIVVFMLRCSLYCTLHESSCQVTMSINETDKTAPISLSPKLVWPWIVFFPFFLRLVDLHKVNTNYVFACCNLEQRLCEALCNSTHIHAVTAVCVLLRCCARVCVLGVLGAWNSLLRIVFCHFCYYILMCGHGVNRKDWWRWGWGCDKDAEKQKGETWFLFDAVD